MGVAGRKMAKENMAKKKAKARAGLAISYLGGRNSEVGCVVPFCAAAYR